MGMEVMETVLERLYADDETKDVEIEMCDGVLWAHSNVLGASSEAIQGMLRHGVAAAKKKLSWRENPMEVGRFVLRLLYTGTIVEDEWEGCDETTERSAEREVPLRLILGGLSIAKVYQVPHLIHAFIEALKRRLTDDSFDDICSAAIKLDVMAVRLFCLRYAEQPHRNEIKDGARVKALRLITADCALVHEGVMGTVNSQNRIQWDNRFITRADLVREMVEVVSSPTMNRVHDLYKAKELSPEVMSELAGLWGPVDPVVKRRRTL